MKTENLKLKESHNGFSERDIHSKAILNQDKNALLRYKIQRSRMIEMSEKSHEIQTIREELNDIKNEFHEMKLLLKKIAKGLEQ